MTYQAASLAINTANADTFRVTGSDVDGVRLTIDLGDRGRVDFHADGWDELRRFVCLLEDAVAAADLWVHSARPGAPWAEPGMVVLPIDGPAYEVA